jgi:hypothetical protein
MQRIIAGYRCGRGLVSQDIAAGNASFVEVFSHEALKKLPPRTD